jgi:hypothetical protein
MATNEKRRRKLMAILNRYSEKKMQQTREHVHVLPSTTENGYNLELMIMKECDGGLPIHATVRLSADETRRVFKIIDGGLERPDGQ